jgi:hypothetical protein
MDRHRPAPGQSRVLREQPQPLLRRMFAAEGSVSAAVHTALESASDGKTDRLVRRSEHRRTSGGAIADHDQAKRKDRRSLPSASPWGLIMARQRLKKVRQGVYDQLDKLV